MSSFPKTARALWHMDSLHSALKNVGLSADTDLLPVRACYSLISTGTEKRVSLGGLSKNLQKHMTVPYMDGSFQLPLKYGYSLVGSLEDEQPIHIMHPHQDFLKANPPDFFYLKPSVPLVRYTLLSNMETVVNAIWDSSPQSSDDIAICGFGNIGSLLANTLKQHYQIEAGIIETNPWRKLKAESLGWNVLDTVKEDQFNLIYHCSGSQKGLQYCLDHLRMEGRLIELSWYGDESVSIKLGHAFHYKRLQIISSQVSAIPFSKAGEEDFNSRKKLAESLLSDSSYDELISDIIPFDSSPAFFNDLRKGRHGDGLIWAIKY